MGGNSQLMQVGDLKYIQDAAQAPLKQCLDDAAFEKKYGLKRRLQFDHYKPRNTPSKLNLWEGVY